MILCMYAAIKRRQTGRDKMEYNFFADKNSANSFLSNAKSSGLSGYILKSFGGFEVRTW